MRFEEAAEEMGRQMRRAVEKRSSDSFRPGVFLSGGLDSRTIVGMLPKQAQPPITATFGSRACRDVYYAQQIAQAVGSRHHWFDMPNGQWVLDNVDLHFKLTEGFHSWIHMHGIHMLPTLRPLMDYNLSGWDGGSVMVNWYFPDEMNTRPQNIEQRRHPMNFPVDDDALTAEIYRRLLVRFTWPGLNEGEERMLLDAPIGQELIGRAYHSFRNEYQRYQKYRQERRAEFFYLNNFCFRLTGNMITFQRSHMEVRFPFWDYDLIDFLCGLRPMLRYDRLMYRTMITRELPALARIPMDDGEVLPTVQQPLHNLHSLSMRVLRRLKLIPRRPTLYADYDAYLWTDLRPWAESILFDRRTESRGLTNPAFVRSLMARSVVDHETPMIGKIASLITLEMVMREYFD
jgi:asparagine synthase (glutamine-hydrolysing)